MFSTYESFNSSSLFKAARVLKVGGKLVYSTCTVAEEENEGLVAWVLRECPALRLVPATPLLGGPGWAGCLNDEQR